MTAERDAYNRRKLRYIGCIAAAAVAYAVIVRIHPGAEWLLPWLYMFSGYLTGALREGRP